MNFALAMDAFESVKHAPTSSLLWQRLSALTHALQGEAHATLVNEIAALPFDARGAQWLRYSALAYLTGDPAWLVRQASLVDETTAPDAVMTLLGLAWHHALVRTSESGAFVQSMKDINAPRLQDLLARRMSGQKREQGARDLPVTPLRVAIYTPQVVSSRHGGTTFTLNVMSVLAREGLDLRTFSAQETNIPAVYSYHGGAESLTPVSVEAESLTLNAPGSFQLILPDTRFSLRLRFDQILQAIDAYSPDVVIFVGFMSPLAFKFYEHYPVVGLSVHALPPVAPVDVWLSADPQRSVVHWSGVPAPQIFPFSFRFWPAGQATPVDRSSIDLPADATVLVTAGFRLSAEITAPWSERVLAFIEAHTDVHWLLIGGVEELSPAVLPQHPRIHRLPPQPRLETWLAMCDIYLNPPRIGGGGALAMAMEQGLAVLTFANSDGGDKVGEQAINSDKEYFARLEAWVVDPMTRSQVGDALKVRFHDRLDFSGKESAVGLIQACQKAIELFNRRRVDSGA